MGVSLWVSHAWSFIVPLFAEVSLYQREQTQKAVFQGPSQSSPLSKRSTHSEIWGPKLLSHQGCDDQVTLPAVWVCLFFK